jgi:hypothetical protein
MQSAALQGARAQVKLTMGARSRLTLGCIRTTMIGADGGHRAR